MAESGEFVRKIAIVTGAASGIGAAVVSRLLSLNYWVVAVDKDAAAFQKQPVMTNCIQIIQDLRDEAGIISIFEMIRQQYGKLDVCVNCAGLSHFTHLTDGNGDDWKEMLEVNVLVASVCCREAIKLMTSARIKGHLVNISSNLAHHVPSSENGYLRFYSGTKFALHTIMEGLRQELRESKSQIRISSVSPGLVKTGFMDKTLKHFDPEKLRCYYKNHPYLKPEDVADAVVYALSVPPNVEINEITMYGIDTEEKND